jgi:precorrin-3B synthase
MAGLPIPLPMSAPRDEHAMPVGLLTRNETAFGVGIGLPFGRIDADQLRVLCNAAVASDALVIHTGPQRVLVFPLRDGSQGARLLRVADDMRLIVDAADIRLAMDVCPGAPACGSARADTRDDAQHFADTFSGSLEGRSIHISGCEKGCARRSAASFTLVGRGGYYDIIRDGCASAANGEGTVEAGDIGAAISRRLAEPTT